MSNNFAHLNKDSEWYPIFPNGTAPIKQILMPAGVGNMDGAGELKGQGKHEFYDLDLDRLTPGQWDAIVALLCKKSGCSEAEVRNGIKAQGRLPLTARHV